MMRQGNSSAEKWVLLVNLLIMLFPPIYLSFASGSMKLALTYFFGSGLILVLSMILLRSMSANTGEE